MSNLNICAFQGNLVAAPEIVGKESNVARFTVAVNNGFGDNRTTSFIPCVAFGKQVETISKHFEKGKQVIVRGSLIQNNWTDKGSGANRSRLELRLDGFNGFSFVSGGNGGAASEATTEASAPADAPASEPVEAAAGGGEDGELF